MGIRPKNLNRRPVDVLQPVAYRSCVAEMWYPPENTFAVCASQTIASLAANHPNLGLTNSLLLNGTGDYKVIDQGAVDRNVFLPLPAFVHLNITNTAYFATIRMHAIDAFGREFTETKRKSNTTSNIWMSSRPVSFIYTMELLEYTGNAGADSISGGYYWTNAGSTRAFPVPFEVTRIIGNPSGTTSYLAAGDISGVELIDGGGAGLAGSWQVGGAAPTALLPSVLSLSVSSGAEATDVFGAEKGRSMSVNIACTNPTTPPVTVVKYRVIPKNPRACLRY